jgi:hypothetical protein
MLFLVAFIGAVVVAVVLWKAMNSVRADGQPPVEGPRRTTRPRVSGPDDDPAFLRRIDEKLRREEPPPTT